MNAALLLEARHATGSQPAVYQQVYAGTAGKRLYEHQKQPVPAQKAVYQVMLKVAQMSDAHFVFVPRKNSVVN